VAGLSSNITVRSIVDRFLEHSRIFCFDNACRPEVFLSSADWMPRNFFRRIETGFPILDGRLRERVISELLALPLADNLRARRLTGTGKYQMATANENEPPRRSQFEFIERAVKSESPKPVARNGESRYPKMIVRKRPIF
jgi:polyphosphate kinase